jgi:hypothetical protein
MLPFGKQQDILIFLSSTWADGAVTTGLVLCALQGALIVESLSCKDERNTLLDPRFARFG